MTLPWPEPGTASFQGEWAEGVCPILVISSQHCVTSCCSPGWRNEARRMRPAGPRGDVCWICEQSGFGDSTATSLVDHLLQNHPGCGNVTVRDGFMGGPEEWRRCGQFYSGKNSPHICSKRVVYPTFSWSRVIIFRNFLKWPVNAYYKDDCNDQY